MFNDPASEINSLVHGIKENMQALNSELDASQARKICYCDMKNMRLSPWTAGVWSLSIGGRDIHGLDEPVLLID